MSNGNGLSQRDLLLEVREDVREIKTALAAKADREDMHRLEGRLSLIDRDGSHGLRALQKEVADHDTRLELLERAEVAGEAVMKYRKWIVPVLVSGTGLLITTIGLIVTNFFH